MHVLVRFAIALSNHLKEIGVHKLNVCLIIAIVFSRTIKRLRVLLVLIATDQLSHSLHVTGCIYGVPFHFPGHRLVFAGLIHQSDPAGLYVIERGLSVSWSERLLF